MVIVAPIQPPSREGTTPCVWSGVARVLSLALGPSNQVVTRRHSAIASVPPPCETRSWRDDAEKQVWRCDACGAGGGRRDLAGRLGIDAARLRRSEAQGVGSPSEQGARLHATGGCTLRDAQRYCLTCFNEWPTKPNVNKPAGRPEWIERRIVETRFEYAKLSALAGQPPCPEEPHVERSWARIDGSVAFLVSFGDKKARIAKSLEYARLGGAPAYEAINLLGVCGAEGDYGKLHERAAVAAIRFERAHQPERHNLYNDWDIVQAHRRARDWAWDEESYRRERAKEGRSHRHRCLAGPRATCGRGYRVWPASSRRKTH